MQALGADLQSQRDYSACIEIAARALADLVRFIGEAGEQGAAIRRRVQDEGANSHPPGRANDPAGDLAAIGDEDVCEHDSLV